ncbi:hypothetical protein C5167_004446 [Papaver somniferum]|uniref:Uncharacterized protein n=1 Tax=Papaver somniferum TaxID=3469 RepID=A0A4Y7JAV0_PAPSO|nr:hypothetical protein C5167_004446 [Papaver somniferum]
MYILKDKVKQVWTREETFDVQIKDQEGLLPSPLCCYFDSSTSAVTPPTRILTLSDQVLLYWFDGESLILYNLREKCLKVVKCSRSYPGIFHTKMIDTSGDYQLHDQVENLVCMKTVIPKGAKTSNYDCIEDLQHAIKSNLPAGWVDMGRESSNCYTFSEQVTVPDLEEWMVVLNSLPDIEDDEFKLDAMEYLEGDPIRVRMFMALWTAGLCKKWLLRKIRPATRSV